MSAAPIAPMSPLAIYEAMQAALKSVEALPVEHQVAVLRASLGTAEAAMEARARLYMLGSITSSFKR